MTARDIDDALRSRILPVRLMIFDVDGVLTDGRVIYQDNGSEIKEFNAQDGHGIKLLQRCGIQVAFLSGRACAAVEARARGLGVSIVHQGAKFKVEAFEQILAQTGLREHQAGYMGDDLIDIPVMRRAGFSVAVPNAAPQVPRYAHYVTAASGGRGAAREVCDMILQVQGLWDEVTERYFGISSQPSR